MSRGPDNEPAKGNPSPRADADDLGSTEATGDGHIDTAPELRQRVGPPRLVDVGTVVGGRYRLVERLGGGAMGDVFVAENTAIRLRVAIKLLKPELLADQVFRERFQQEAQAIAAIEHPNVARFLDLVIGDPTFLVMEYVRGQTLAERLHLKGALPLVEAVQVAVRLCWALGAAHAAGIIHRDLKPSNVILTSDLEHGEKPKLIDFGLAKLARQVEKSGLTRTGQVVGTPRYMSPEQISGRAIDERSDMYALGCLLYEMIAGRPPFTGEDDVQVLYQQIHHQPTPLAECVPDVPEALAQVVTRVLAKDPADRYDTVADLARALEASVSGLSVTRASGAPSCPIGEESNTVKHDLPGPPSLTGLLRRRAGWRLLALSIGLVIAAGGGFAAARLRAAPPRPTSGMLLITEPPGAEVTVDGRVLRRKTPTWLEATPGAHTVTFTREGGAPVTQTLSLRDDERAVVQVSLPPVTRRVAIRSSPDGASVFLDGKLVLGETPTYVDLAADDFHELRFVKNGYQTLVKPMTPDDKDTGVSVTLKPETQQRGTLIVDANTAAEVWIDGMNTGYTTPTLGIHVPAGRHLVELRDGTGARGPQTTVTVNQGQTLRVMLGTGGDPAAK